MIGLWRRCQVLKRQEKDACCEKHLKKPDVPCEYRTLAPPLGDSRINCPQCFLNVARSTRSVQGAKQIYLLQKVPPVSSVVEHLSKENGTSAKLRTNPHSKSLQFPEKNDKRGLTAGRFKVRYWTRICYYIILFFSTARQQLHRHRDIASTKLSISAQ